MALIKDSDNTIAITITDASAAVVDLSTLSGYVVTVFQRGGIILDKFSKNTQSGFNQITEVDIANGIISIALNASKTRTAIIESGVYYEYKTLKTNTSFENNTEEFSSGEVFINDLSPSKNKDITFS